jgi:hypothetical protein
MDISLNLYPSIFPFLENIMTEYQDIVKRASDPIQGTVSFSGADYKAIVFIPLRTKAIEQEKKKLEKRVQEVQEQIYSLAGDYESLSVELTYNQGLYDSITDPIARASWASEISKIKTKMLYINPSRIEHFKELYEGLKEEVRQLESANENGVYLKPVVLGNVQTITYSTHREKVPVRACGYVNPKGFTRGQRTIAGSLIFTIINQAALYDLLEMSVAFYNTGVGTPGTDSGYPEMSTAIVDQLPPFDITIVGCNEIGDASYMVIYGVEIVNEGQTMSIQDIITENVMQYVARDLDVLRPLTEDRRIMYNGAEGKPVTASDIAKQSKQRRTDRLNPFI